jgi:AmmeMemoRadiSam system protein B
VRTRPAAVAGRFYPGNAAELDEEVSGYLESAARGRGDAPVPKAVIAPHAGTIYSGPVAASAYARLLPARDRIERVVLLGPAHRVWFEGVATSSADAFTTPLGDIPIDTDAVQRLLKMPGVVESDEAHRLEHSLEVHLPFLQLTLERFRLVPLVVGNAKPEIVGDIIDALWGGDETIIVISSDLSHFHDYDTAARLDRETSSIIERLELEKLNGERACGYQPIRGLLQVARRRGMRAELIDLRSSGDTAGPRREVVGYGSYVVS